MKQSARYFLLATLVLLATVLVGKFVPSRTTPTAPAQEPTSDALEPADRDQPPDPALHSTGGRQRKGLAAETAMADGSGQPRHGNQQALVSRKERPAIFSPGAELQSTAGQGKSRRVYTQWEGKPTANMVDIKIKDVSWSKGMLFLEVECVGNTAQPGESAMVGSQFFNGDPENGGKLIGTGHLALKPGETSGSAVPWHPRGGQYAVFVIVDPESLVAETDKANNRFAKLIDIPATLGPDGNEAPENVDLWVTSDDIALVENKELGTYSIRVSVHVQGNEEPVQVETRVYVGDPAKGGKLIGHHGGTTPSGIRHEEFPWNPYAGEYEVFVVVAPAENEPNTGNNQAAKLFRFAE
jgi:hypothetical protein